MNGALTDHLLESKNPEEVKRSLQAFQDQHGDVELTAARKLKTTPFIVAFAALRHWKHSLTMERDTRLASQMTNTTPARSVQALRGHITRELLTDLLPHVQELMNTINIQQE
jgi:hypothetical protein